MAKRFEPINTFGPAKKVKLDVSLSRGNPNTTTSNVDFWSSDDDDFILLATQQAEKNQHQTDKMQSKEDEFTFCQFAPQVHGTTSTQQTHLPSFRQPTIMTKDEQLGITLPSNLSVEEVFGTDETFVFLPDTKTEKKPATEVVAADFKKWDDCSSSHGTANLRQLAQERQLKFLMERIDLVKKDNVKLHKDLIDMNNQTATKEGEVSLLRNELRQARKLLQASRMDKITIAEAAEKDCNKKVAEVFKKVIAKDAELNFTTVEFLEHKIRNAKHSDKNVFKGSYMPTTIESDYCRNLLRIENLCILKSNVKPLSTKANRHVYEYAKEKRGTKKQRTFLEIELDDLILHFAQLQSQTSNHDTIMENILNSVGRVFSEFLHYANRLELPQNCMLYPYSHFDLQTDDSFLIRNSLVQSDALYKMERAILVRRYIATLTIICRKYPSLSELMLCSKHEQFWLIQIVSEAITKISYSLEICEHFGVFEATGALLHSLLAHINAVKTPSECQMELLFDLLKQLVFSRPNPWVYQEICSCMLLCVRQPYLLTRMCVYSSSNFFVSDRVRSFYRFSPKSCLLQVYAGLVELCFCGDLPLQSSHLSLLLSICESHVRFVYQCFIATPEFILRMLPFASFADNEKEDSDEMVSKVPSINSAATLASTINVSAVTRTNISDTSLIPAQDQATHDQGCECYVKLCLSVVTLIYHMMYQWMLQDKKSDTLQVGEISKIGVHLLTFIFREYYLSSLFHDSEETTKHYLFLLCNWWNDNALILNFEETHVRLLKQLQELQFMLKPLHRESNSSIPIIEMSEWTRITNDENENDHPDVTKNSKSFFKYNTSEFFGGLNRATYTSKKAAATE